LTILCPESELDTTTSEEAVLKPAPTSNRKELLSQLFPALRDRSAVQTSDHPSDTVVSVE